MKKSGIFTPFRPNKGQIKDKIAPAKNEKSRKQRFYAVFEIVKMVEHTGFEPVTPTLPEGEKPFYPILYNSVLFDDTQLSFFLVSVGLIFFHLCSVQIVSKNSLYNL